MTSASLDPSGETLLRDLAPQVLGAVIRRFGDFSAAEDADERLAGHYRLDAVRAHLHEMAGDHQTAIAHYRAAAGRTASIPERNYLTTQAARLSSQRQ